MPLLGLTDPQELEMARTDSTNHASTASSRSKAEVATILLRISVQVLEAEGNLEVLSTSSYLLHFTISSHDGAK